MFQIPILKPILLLEVQILHLQLFGKWGGFITFADNTEDARETKSLLDSLLNTSNLRTKEITAKWHLHENFDTADCEMLPGIPLPFSNELLTETFVYPEDVFQL